MSDPLASYLNDHLGGAQIAIQVLEAMRDQHDDPRFRDFANELLPEIQDDDRTLRSIAEKIGSGPSAAKQAGGWLLEKIARLKLGHTGSTNFRMFESLELLVLGIHGKLCLWKALEVANQSESRLREYDFRELIDRAQQQYDKVESQRLDLVQAVLLSATEERSATQSSMNKVIVYATVISGFVAAYLMYRRGESMVSIARKTVTNPVGSLVSEVKNTV
jgi:hypothetical protein